MKRFLKSSALVALAAVLPWSAKAAAPYTIPKFRLNQYYDSNAVLQRGVTLPICGTAAFGDTVTVTFNGQSKTATANIETAWTAEGGEGRWTVDFPAMEAGGPYTLTVTDGTKTLTATNILIGDVWHLAGQSNSYYPIERFTDDADEWLKDADYPEVRFIEPNSATTGHMQHLLNQDYWYPLSSATGGKCSALGFFFVKELRKTVNVPMGIINSAADGTAIDNWIPSTTKNGYASKMLNDLEPMVPFPVKGVLWYQGETDGMFAKGVQYRYELQKLVQQWRAAWNDADMPFLVPQLPFYYLYDEKWTDVRLSQNWAAAHESNVYVVSTLDLSDLNNIHPRTKPELGARLSVFARKYIYGEAGIYPDGPIYKSCEVNPSDSTELLVHFDVHGSITSRDGTALKGFRVGGIRSGTRQYYDATVRIVNGTTLGLKNANITSPDSVRYGCHNIEPSSVNFFDSLGFPARAFSSEDEAGGGDDDDDDDDDDPDHVHGWKFTLSGSVLTAVCTNAGCTAGTPTLSISGGDTKSYDGSPLKVSLTGDDLAARTISQIGPIEYYQGEEKLPGAPTAVGVYEARVQVIHDSDIYVLKKTLTIAEAGEPVPAHDHVWGEASYDWSSDFFTCTASADCTVAGCSVTTGETATASYEIVTPATETSVGLGRYTVTFVCTLFAAQQKEVEIPATAVASQPSFGNYEKAIEFTTSGYTGSETLTDFPVLVRLGENSPVGFSYADAGSDGSNIRFADALGNELPCEVEAWNTSGESLIWVKLPSLDATTKFTMYFKGQATTAATPTAVWNANYGAVWHMDEANGVCANSTANGSTYDATPAGDATKSVVYAGADAPIGNARTTASDGTKAYLSVPSYDALGYRGVFTMSGWVRLSTVTGYPRLFSRKTAYTANNGWELQMNSGSSTAYSARANGADTAFTANFQSTVGADLKNNWVHIALVYNNNTLSVYGNGKLSQSGSVTSLNNGASYDNGLPLSIGCNSNGTETHAQGAFDECRLMGVAASADWVKAEYQQGVAGSGFLSAGEVQQVGSPTVVANPKFSPEAGTVCGDTEVTISCQTDGATIRYTLDGTDPDANSDVYENPINVTATVTIKAIAFKEGLDASEIVSATYTYEAPVGPTLGAVTVTPKTTSAAISGSITSVGNNGATECDVYLSLNGAAATKLGTSAAGAFGYTVSGLTAETEYSYTLSISNNATTAMGAETSGSFTTTAAPSGLQPSGDTTGATDRRTIQDAIDASALESPAGTVTLGEGTFYLDAELSVTGGVKLVGAGWDQTIVTPASGLKIRCVYVDGGATVEGMTLTGGNADLGSGAWIKNGTVSWCKLINNGASVANCHGVGVSFTEGQGQVDHCIIAGNSGWIGTSGIGIGAMGPTGAITIDTCLIYENKTWTTTGSGAAIGIYNHNFDCTVRNCTIVGNTANLYGVVYHSGGSGKLILVNDIAVGNFLFNGTEANVHKYVNEAKNCLFGLASEILTGMTDCLSGDPVFVGGGDYRLQASSPAKGAGLAGVGVKDLDNKNFANTPSIGCYEAVTVKSGTLIMIR